MSSSSPKHKIYGCLAEIAQALGHAHRLELLEQIAQGARSVDQLAKATGLTIANASRHLQLLRRARLVEPMRSGKSVFYRLEGEREVVTLLNALGRAGERNVADIRTVMHDYFEQRDALDAISRTELLARIRRKDVTIIDVRPSAEFALGHVPGAMNIPIDELERRLAELPKRREIVAYCRGPYCVMSFEAVAFLRSKGYRVRRLEDGFPEWKAAGLKVAVAA